MILNSKADDSREADRARRELWRKRLAREARQERRSFEDRPYPDSPRVVAARAFLKGLGLFRRGVCNASHPRLHTLALSFASLPPAFDGFRILHLSDFHFDPRLDVTEAACALVKTIEADLCVLTGDFRFNQGASCRAVYAGLGRIVEGIRARHGITGILGNNDVAAMVDPMRAMGIRMLINEGFAIERDDAAIWIGGVDDPHDFRAASIAAAFDGAPDGAFAVLLAHSPELIKCAERHGADLYLCGHTHGGQICLPFLGPFFLNTRCPRRFSAGPWRHGNMQGFTTTGLGASTLPVRYNCRPEAALIELRRLSG